MSNRFFSNTGVTKVTQCTIERSTANSSCLGTLRNVNTQLQHAHQQADSRASPLSKLCERGGVGIDRCPGAEEGAGGEAVGHYPRLLERLTNAGNLRRQCTGAHLQPQHAMRAHAYRYTLSHTMSCTHTHTLTCTSTCTHIHANTRTSTHQAV